MRSCKFRRLLSGSGVMKSPWPGSEPRQNLCVLVLIGTLIRWSLSVRKRARAMVDLIKLTNLLDEAKGYETRVRGFSGCGFETIAGLKVELGLERVDLVGGNGRDDMNEGVDDGSMFGQIEG